MKPDVPQLAERLRAAVEVSRYAEASKLYLLCELAEGYGVGEQDVLDVLVEQRIVIGAEGTPRVSEFLALEVAGLLECSPSTATARIADALGVKYRHPALFDAAQRLEVDADRACRAARMCADLAPECAASVVERWIPQQQSLTWTGAFSLLKRLIIEADEESAAARERAAREARGVFVWGFHEGTMNVTGRLDVLDARYLDGMVDRIADILGEHHPTLSKDERRAKALGVLANPARALAMLQSAAQPGLLDDEAETCCTTPLCGRIVTPLAQLLPTLELAVHVHADAVGGLVGSARVERAGHITTSLLAELLGDVDVTVQPVIDLAELPSEDAYRPSARLVRALRLAMATEMFLFSSRSSRRLDLDHTLEFAGGCRGQTRMGNLGPLSRRVHRAKTARYWRVKQRDPAHFIWISPLGYRYCVTPRGTRALTPLKHPPIWSFAGEPV